jgi:hypothetical protein
VKRALDHLHAIGEIVLFREGRICTNPSSISHLMAKFISPEQVRNDLLWDYENQVVLLSKTDINSVLGVNKLGNTRYSSSLFPVRAIAPPLHRF